MGTNSCRHEPRLEWIAVIGHWQELNDEWKRHDFHIHESNVRWLRPYESRVSSFFICTTGNATCATGNATPSGGAMY